MDIEKEQSEHCIRIAKESLAAGDAEKAIRFLQKSMRLHPNEIAEALLNEIQNKKGSYSFNESSNRSSSNFSSASDESLPRRRGTSSHSRSTSDLPESRPGTDHTEEQRLAVERVMKCSTFYEVFQMKKEQFSDSHLKKQYRKLALLLHPDKNKAPGAADAFKIVGKAYDVLSNPQKKADYDAGKDDTYATASRHSQYARGYQQRRQYRAGNFTFYEDEGTSPEDIFNMFFGPGFVRTNAFGQRPAANYARNTRNVQQETGVNPVSLFLGIFFLLFLLTYITDSTVVHGLYRFLTIIFRMFFFY